MAKDVQLIGLEEAMQLGREENIYYHREHCNPRLANLLEVVEADSPLVRAEGNYFWDADNVRYIDFMSGFGAASLGHNPPRVVEVLEKVGHMPNLVEGLALMLGALCHNLAALAPGDLKRVYVANSGAEVIDASIKVARAATGRTKMITCRGSFHGRTVGALSLMDNKAFHDPFTPLLQDVVFVPFGDIPALERALRKNKAAGFILEPVQGEGGFVPSPPGYLRAARDLCSRYGTLMIADEIQCGLCRTGHFFAVDVESVVPDILLLGKTLGGGVMPLSALLTTDDLYFASKGDTPRSPLHIPTYGGNTRACAVGIVVLEELIEGNMAQRVQESGDYLMGRLKALQAEQPLIAEVRGRGLMIGVEFAPATSGLGTLVTAGMANKLSREYLAGIVIKDLLSRHRIMTAYTLNNVNTLRVQPPYTVTTEEMDTFVNALAQTLDEIGSFAKAAVKSIPDMMRLRRA